MSSEKFLSLDDLYPEGSKSSKKEDDVGFFESALAGVATGLWNIPKGIVSLGAEVFDLIGDTNTARDVEQWFDDVNPFDDEAEARTVGKIMTAIASIGPVAVKGAQIGVQTAINVRKTQFAKDLAKRAVKAKQDGKILNLSRIGEKIMGPATSKLGGAVIGGGVGEALVADEDIGTFADIARGTSLEPLAITMMDKETKEGRSEAFRRLQNRLKFGTEGALFNLALIGAGTGIKNLRKPAGNFVQKSTGQEVTEAQIKELNIPKEDLDFIETGLPEYSDNQLVRFLQKAFYGLKPEREGTKQIFESSRFSTDRIKAVEIASTKAAQDLDLAIDKIFPAIEKDYLVAGRKSLDQTSDAKENLLSDLYDVLRPQAPDEKLLKPKAKDQAIQDVETVIQYKNLQREILQKTDELTRLNVSTPIQNQGSQFTAQKNNIVNQIKKLKSEMDKLGEKNKGMEGLQKLSDKITDRGIFKTTDYNISPKFKKILDKIESSGGSSKNIREAVLGFRVAIDNMSVKLLQNQMPKEIADDIKKNLGSYLNTQYRQFENLSILKKYKPSGEQIEKAVKSVIANKEKAFFQKEKRLPTLSEKKDLIQKANDEVTAFTKASTVDEVPDLTDPAKLVSNKPTKSEVDSLVIQDSILRNKVLLPWQEELAGLIKNPTYAYQKTISKQARLNYSLDYLNDVAKFGSTGPGKFIFKESELSPKDLTDTNKFKKVDSKGANKVTNALEGLYVKAPLHDAIFDTTSNWLQSDGIGTYYKYTILAPKAASQIAKTILSPITHVRNFISAGAFVGANGAAFPNYGDIKTLAPKFLGGEGVFSKAYDLTGKRILGTMTKADDQLYERLVNVGVVDSQVQVGEAKKLIQDILLDPAAADRKVYNNLSNNLTDKIKKIYAKTQDAYVAEDDFWKITNFFLERNRYSKVLGDLKIDKDNYRGILQSDPKAIASLGKNGENVAKYFRKLAQRADYANKSFDNFLDEISGNLTRNLVPNYAYVGRTARALRASPFGNFIAFPIEILRTGNNIFTRAIDDITSGIPQIEAQGYKRLFSFGITVGGIPYGIAETSKAIHGATDEEISALRRMVPEWSKNSTLVIRGRNEKGYLKYTDFSYSNAYDTLIRPFNAIVNEISQGTGDRDSLMKSLAKGMGGSLREILEPFATESIYTEALLDVVIRNGIGREGRRIWSEEDDFGKRLFKSVGHLAKSLEPGSFRQFIRLGEAAGQKADNYGATFNVFDELQGLAGFRVLQADPERAMTYKTTRFGRNLKLDENLFTSPLLRGGRITPKEIIDTYKYSESRRYQTAKEFYKDIEAARKLGMSENLIRKKIKGRKGIKRKVVDKILQGKYEPNQPSEFFKDRIRKITNDLNEKENVDLENPFTVARPFLNEIILENKNRDLINEEISLPDFTTEDIERSGRSSFTIPFQTPPLGSTPAPNPDIIQTQTPLTSEQTIDRIRAFGGR